MREKETWKELAENLYFKQAQSMTQIAEFLTDIPYRTIQKHIQRHPNYRTRNNRNIQNAIDSLGYTVKKQTETMNRLKESDRCPQPEQDVYEWVKLGDYQQLQDTKTWDSSPYLMDRVTKPIVPFEPLHTPRIVGTIGDTHFPFVSKGYLPFLIDTFEKYGVTDIVHCGDMCDGNAISRFQSDPNGMSAVEEYDQSLNLVKQYAKEFPKLKYCYGNHSLIPERQAATLGIPKNYMKDVRQLWEFPTDWEVGEQYVIDRVLYEHGLGWGGKTGALDKATNAMMSCVIGHSHAFGGCLYKSNSEQLIFGLNAGCGINIKQYAFAYSKHDKSRAVLGCGIVFNSSNAIFVPMDMKYFNMGE